MAYYPDIKVVVAVLANVNGPTPDAMLPKLAAAAHGDAVQLTTERKEITVSADILARYVGVYGMAPGVNMAITLADGQLISAVGQIYFFTLHSTNPAYDVMELKSIEDWVVEKNLKQVPNIVDVASFGGPTREYQVRVDPDKLVDYGLSFAQVEQQLTNNNANAGGSFIEAGMQQIISVKSAWSGTFATSRTPSF